MKVNVLGTDYEIILDGKETEYKHLKENDGYCDFTSKKIVIAQMSEEAGYEWESVQVHMNKVIRHELVHAFLYESGLDSSCWARDEEIVDWMAIQIPKLSKSFTELEIN